MSVFQVYNYVTGRKIRGDFRSHNEAKTAAIVSMKRTNQAHKVVETRVVEIIGTDYASTFANSLLTRA